MLRRGGAARPWPNQLGVAQLDQSVIEQLVRQREHLAPGTFGSPHKIGATRVLEHLCDLQAGGLERFPGGTFALTSSANLTKRFSV